MNKIIAIKYKDFCRQCNRTITKNTLVMWTGKEGGVYCFPKCWFEHERST